LSEHARVRAGLWSLRAGALLAGAASSALADLPALVLWQPVLAGKAHLTQFLRLKVAAEALGAGATTVSTSDLVAQLKRGETLEIAGYRLPPAVALPMAESELGTPAPGVRVQWFEVNAEASLSPAGQRVVNAWQSSGVVVHARAVAGPPFWQTQELEDCPPLIDATRDALSGTDG
jgi:exosortase A-associated hydrolase 2